MKRDDDEPTLATAMADARAFLRRHRGWAIAAVGAEILLAVLVAAYLYFRG